MCSNTSSPSRTTSDGVQFAAIQYRKEVILSSLLVVCQCTGPITNGGRRNPTSNSRPGSATVALLSRSGIMLSVQRRR